MSLTNQKAGFPLWHWLSVSFVACAWLADPGTPGFTLRLAWFYGPLLSVVLLTRILRGSKELTLGAHAGAFLFFLVFAGWVFSAEHPEGLAWVSYLFCFPGAWVGATVAVVLEHLLGKKLRRFFATGGALVLGGIALNALILAAYIS
ncbi:hypothetical protein IFT48_03220 [Pseudomonas fluorescens]|uniref:hypothetical protein n=1 Tax=Pseudomonas fluorescens TaxID=294 RepID=UPI001930CB38|nr:hypothetical protein [Pseudomonas fluorescens]MBD8088979.1 hypothetical protein [Pseudomonas fluorescens]